MPTCSNVKAAMPTNIQQMTSGLHAGCSVKIVMMISRPPCHTSDPNLYPEYILTKKSV